MPRIMIPDKNDLHPWSVFIPETGLHAEPISDTAPLRMLVAGTMVSGTVLTHPDTDEDWLATKDGFVSLTTIHRVHPDNDRAGTLPAGTEVIDRWWGLPIEYVPGDLVEVPPEWTIQDGKEYRLRLVAWKALEDLLLAAREDGVEIRVLSAYRAGEYQRQLYLKNIARHGRAQRASAPPGHSEHQLGTAVDLCDVEEKEVLTAEFEGTSQGIWLHAHANRFGFFRSYTKENTGKTGYIPEPWHWRFHGVE